MSPNPARSTLLAGVDRAVFAAAFVDRLRQAGLAVSIHSAERLAAAMAATEPRRRVDLYWVSRVCLVNDPAMLPTFDRLFDIVFTGGALPTGRDARKSESTQSSPAPTGTFERLPNADPTEQSAGSGVPWTHAPSATVNDDEDNPDSDDPLILPELLPASLAQIADREFDRLDEDQLAEIGAWLESVQMAWPERPTRRHRRRRRGSIDHRATLARARRTSGEPVELAYRSPARRRRKVAMVADVSGSMQTFVRPYLHLMRALSNHADAEVFAFATAVTRITPALSRVDPRRAIDDASAAVDDRFGGTRIATSLASLMSHPTWSTAIRGAVVVVASDGWDTDPPEDMDRRMARLGRLAERIVWINPRSAAENYQPLVAGMAAALPYCDAFCSGHSLRALRGVLSAIASR